MTRGGCHCLATILCLLVVGIPAAAGFYPVGSTLPWVRSSCSCNPCSPPRGGLLPPSVGTPWGGKGKRTWRPATAAPAACSRHGLLPRSASPSSQEGSGGEGGADVRSALVNTGLATLAGAIFGGGVIATRGWDSGLEYFAGYVVELSLSVDNLFVFLLLFEYFRVPVAYQSRVLSFGILGAVVMRGIFIALGEVAIEKFQPALLVFAGILLFSSIKILTEGDEEESEDLSNNLIVKYSNKFLNATEEYDDDNFFTVIDDVRRATPLLLVLVCVELTDILFAVDSIPAVFGITTDPFVVYTSNIFAILNLRSLYTVLSSAIGNLPYLQPAVAAVLGFVGLKLGGEYFGYEISPATSLAIIAAILGSGVGLSLVQRDNEVEDS